MTTDKLIKNIARLTATVRKSGALAGGTQTHTSLRL